MGLRMPLLKAVVEVNDQMARAPGAPADMR
jgi:hypothetical protein